MNKKIIYSLLCAILVVTCVINQGCNNDSEEQITFSEEQKYLIQKYDFVGIEHNKIVSEVFNELKKTTKASDVFTKENAIGIIKQKTENILREEKPYYEKVINFDKFYTGRISTRSSNANEQYIDSIINSVQSSQFTTIIKELLLISDDFTLSIKEHKQEIDKLNKLAFSILTEEELGYFLVGSSTASASFEYWTNNIQDWAKLLTGRNITTPRLKTRSESNSGGSITDGATAADVGGAVAGAIAGGITGACVGGVGAGPGAAIGAVGGGVGSSVGKVAENIVNNYF